MKKILLLASALTVATPTAFAQSYSRFYLGAGLGQSKITEEYDFTNIVQPVPGATAGYLSTDRTDTAGRAFFGFRITPHFGVEAGYQSFGRFNSRQTITAPVGMEGSYDTTWKVHGGHIDALLTIPIGDVMSISGKLGAIRATTDVTSSTPLGNTTRSGNRFALRYGVALQVDMSKWFALRLDADVNKGATVGSLLGFSGDARLDYNVFTGNVLFKF